MIPEDKYCDECGAPDGLDGDPVFSLCDECLENADCNPKVIECYHENRDWNCCKTCYVCYAVNFSREDKENIARAMLAATMYAAFDRNRNRNVEKIENQFKNKFTLDSV